MHTLRLSTSIIFITFILYSLTRMYWQGDIKGAGILETRNLLAKSSSDIPTISEKSASTSIEEAFIQNVSVESTTFCGGETLPVTFTTQGILNADNTFVVQLSDATGSFTTPAEIGKGMASPIAATLPSYIDTGKAYRIRVIATSPSVNGGDNGKDITIFSRPSAPFIPHHTFCGWGIDGGTVRIYTGEPPLGQTFRWYATKTSSTPMSEQQEEEFVTPYFTVDTTLYVSLVGENGCESERHAVPIDFVLSPTFDQGLNEKVCIDKPAFKLNGFTPADGVWSGTGVTANGIFDPALAGLGTHTLMFKYTNGRCSAWNFKEVQVHKAPVFIAGVVNNSCTSSKGITNLIPFTTSFTNESQHASDYLWEFGDGSTSMLKTPTHTYNEPGQYDVYLTITTEAGCNERHLITSVEALDNKPIPNVFTPNGDNLNEVFVVNVTCLPTHLRVFNRWGKLIFEKANYQNDWNGIGHPAGIYYYQLQASNGQSWKGWVEIIR